MILYPNKYFDKITDISVQFLNKNNIKALILDVDNTLIDIDKKMIDKLEEWVDKMKENNIKLYVLSNSNKLEKVKQVSDKLKLEYSHFGMKPLKRGFKKALKILNEKPENVAVIGDQIFTDVLGANRCKMFSILVKPIDEKDIWITVLKRPIENRIIERYKKSLKENF